MKNRFMLLMLTCLLITSFYFAASGQTEANAEDKPTFKIGYIDSFTGAPAPYGMETRAGVELAVDEINKKGGIAGRQVEVLARDDKASPDTGLSQAKDLVLGEKVDWLIGVTISNVGLSVSAFSKEQKVPFMSTIAVSERLTGECGHRYYFRMNTNTTVYAYASAVAASKLNLKKWWLLAQDYEFGHACVNAFKKVLKERQPDVEFIGEGWPKLGNPDFTPFLTPIVTSDAQGLYNAIGSSDFLRIYKDGKRLGLFEKVSMIGPDLGMINVNFPIGRDMPEGIWGATTYPFWEHASNPRSEFLYQNILKKIGRPPGNGSPNGYEAVWAIARAVEKAGTTDREAVIDAMEKMTFDTVVGPVKFRDFDHQATWPFWFGQTKFVPEYPNFPILANTFKIGEEAFPTKEATMQARTKK